MHNGPNNLCPDYHAGLCAHIGHNSRIRTDNFTDSPPCDILSCGRGLKGVSPMAIDLRMYMNGVLFLLTDAGDDLLDSRGVGSNCGPKPCLFERDGAGLVQKIGERPEIPSNRIAG
jgi:hypothetical protein